MTDARFPQHSTLPDSPYAHIAGAKTELAPCPALWCCLTDGHHGEHWPSGNELG